MCDAPLSDADVQKLIEDAQALHRQKPAEASRTIEKLLLQIPVQAGSKWRAQLLLIKAELQRVLHPGLRREGILQDALTAAEQSGQIDMQVSAHNALGILAYESHNATMAYVHLSAALELAQPQANQRQIALVCNSLGIMYALTGEYKRAVRYLYDSLAAYKKLGDIRGVGAAYGNIGAMYAHMGEVDASIEFCERSMRHRLEAKDKVGAVSTSINLATALLRKGEHQRAIKPLRAALVYAQDNKLCELAQIHSILAYIYAHASELQEAQRHLNAIQLQSVKSSSNQNQCAIAYYRASAFIELKKYAPARKIIKELLDRYASGAPPANFETFHRLLARALKGCEKHTEANQHLRIADQLREEHRSLEVVQQVQGISARRDLLNAESVDKAGFRDMIGRAQYKQRLEDTLHAHVRSSKVLGNIRGEIVKLLPDLDHSTRPIAQTTLSKIDSALQSLQHSPLPDGYLEKQHASLIFKLASHATNLTPTELRVCVLLQLNFRSKEIAEMLSCASTTIGTHRKNIRKKLHLENRENLTSFLLALETSGPERQT